MDRQRADVASESLHNILNVLHGYPINDLLNHVVAILVLDGSDYILFQLLDHVDLLISQGMLKSLVGTLTCTTVVAMDDEPTFCTTRQAYI